MKTIKTIQNTTVRNMTTHPCIHTIKLTLTVGLCIGLLACSNPDALNSAATQGNQANATSESKVAADAHHDMKGMDHQQMNHTDMNAQEPAEALGQDYSIYQVGGDWTDQNSNTFELDKLQGKNQVVVMAYTSCQHTCPVLVQSMKQMYKEMTPEARSQTEFLLATLDTERDTVDVMKNFAEHNELGDNWRLIRSNEASTRVLANTLNIKYQFADNGDINHSNLISVLDKDGRLVAQGVGVADSGIQPLIEYLNTHS
ncbi:MULTISPECIES: SCO family protein [unclassified Psychrobacter]|uniref:SCO family protein n=1 Tax=unclassified Psychrobacter TaxID=196806 RepID=UPI0025E13824|nr:MULTISPECIES: SCO family protein [unclassified Psychrobacter]